MYHLLELDTLPGGRMLESLLMDSSNNSKQKFADEDAKNFYMTMEVPGFKKEDLAITAEGRKVRVEGKSSHEKLESSIDYYFVAPKAIKQSNIQAHLEDGILTVTIPKDEPESFKIEIN
jgi:HSP20 family protein